MLRLSLFLVLSLVCYGPLATAGLQEKSTLIDQIQQLRFGQWHFNMGVGFRNWRDSNNLNLSQREITPTRAMELEQDLSERNFDPNQRWLVEDYKAQETRWQFQPSLGIKLDNRWNILIALTVVNSDRSLVRQGSESALVQSAFDQSYRQQGINPTTSQSRTYWESVELVSANGLVDAGNASMDMITSVQVPISDQRNEYSLFGANGDENQIDVELGLLARNGVISGTSHQSMYVYYRSQLESQQAIWEKDPQTREITLNESVTKDSGDFVGVEFSNSWRAQKNWILKTTFEYMKRYRDKISAFNESMSDVYLRNQKEQKLVALESSWKLSELITSVRMTWPVGSPQEASPEYMMMFSKVY